MGEVMEINGTMIDRDMIHAWLTNKHVALWSDWLIGDRKEQEAAVDWILKQMGSLSEFAGKPTDGPDPLAQRPAVLATV